MVRLFSAAAASYTAALARRVSKVDCRRQTYRPAPSASRSATPAAMSRGDSGRVNMLRVREACSVLQG